MKTLTIDLEASDFEFDDLGRYLFESKLVEKLKEIEVTRIQDSHVTLYFQDKDSNIWGIPYKEEVARWGLISVERLQIQPRRMANRVWHHQSALALIVAKNLDPLSLLPHSGCCKEAIERFGRPSRLVVEIPNYLKTTNETIMCCHCKKTATCQVPFWSEWHTQIPVGWFVSDTYPPGDLGLRFACSIECIEAFQKEAGGFG